jgi:hypothetical protein
VKKALKGTILHLKVNIINFKFFDNTFLYEKCSDIGENNQPDINWEGLGFSLIPTDYMHVMKCAKGEKFSQGTLMRYGNIELSPSAGILNYGQVKIAQ